jgi:hypothetical protein
MVEQELSGVMRVPCGESRDVPFWELLVNTAAVFVRVANTGVTGYGTWKKVRKIGDEGNAEGKSRRA